MLGLGLLDHLLADLIADLVLDHFRDVGDPHHAGRRRRQVGAGRGWRRRRRLGLGGLVLGLLDQRVGAGLGDHPLLHQEADEVHHRALGGRRGRLLRPRGRAEGEAAGEDRPRQAVPGRVPANTHRRHRPPLTRTGGRPGLLCSTRLTRADGRSPSGGRET